MAGDTICSSPCGRRILHFSHWIVGFHFDDPVVFDFHLQPAILGALKHNSLVCFSIMAPFSPDAGEWFLFIFFTKEHFPDSDRPDDTFRFDLPKLSFDIGVCSRMEKIVG